MTDLTNIPTRNGVTPLLTTLLDSPALDKHRALVAVELEVLAKKFDRFGWDRDLGTDVHDRLLTDWMAALADYPLGEVQAACVASVLANPNKMPNEGHVKAQIIKARQKAVAAQPKPVAVDTPREPLNAAQKAEADDLVQGFARRAGGAQ